MARNANDYRSQLISLLPRGKAWGHEVGSRVYEFLTGQSKELARIDDRSQELLEERQVAITNELLEDHELDFDLPETCIIDEVPFAPNLTIAERRLALTAKLQAIGQQNPQYFIDLAADLGYTATITEHTAFWCGQSKSGDGCGNQENLFYWTFSILVAADPIFFLSGSSSSGDSLQKIPDVGGDIPDIVNLAFCYAEIYKPAHTTMLREILGPEFSNAFGPSFHAYGVSTAQLTGPFSHDFGLGFNVRLGGAFGRGFDKEYFVVPL